MHTETLAVPIGTIEPDAQCIGGTGRRTPCKQHPAEVKALLSRSLSAVEIRGGTKKRKTRDEAEFEVQLAQTSKTIALESLDEQTRACCNAAAHATQP